MSPFRRHNPETNRKVLDSVLMWRLAIMIGAVMASLALFLSVYLFAQNRSVTDQIHDNQIAACRSAGEPTLDVLESQLKQAIQQSESFDYSKFFPNVPPAQLHELIAHQVAQQKHQLHLLRAIPPCKARYPLP